MATIVDSYTEDNSDGVVFLSSIDNDGVSQSFTGDGTLLTQATFYGNKVGSPTGDVTANLYAHSGTFGTSSVPTGAALASATVDASVFPQNISGLVDFTFDGTFNLESGTKYVIAIEYSGGNIANYLRIGHDGSSPTHGGNYALLDSGSWAADSARDTVFYVYGTVPVILMVPKFKGLLIDVGRMLS